MTLDGKRMNNCSKICKITKNAIRLLQIEFVKKMSICSEKNIYNLGYHITGNEIGTPIVIRVLVMDLIGSPGHYVD